MVNTKGWVRIIEATICALLIIAVVLIYAQDNKTYFNIENYADVESVIDELIKEKEIREKIIGTSGSNLGKPNQDINFELSKRIKRSGIIINNTICDVRMINLDLCKISSSQEILNVFVYERTISATLDQKYDFLETKVIKVIIYQEGR